MKYIMKYKDYVLLQFTLENNVIDAIIQKENEKYLPLPLKRIINHKTEFIQSETFDHYVLNEDGNWLIEAWINDREIPIDRDKLDKYIEKGKRTRDFMLDNYACSYTDCYWIHSIHKQMIWEDIIKYQQKHTDTLKVILQNNRRMYAGINATLGGSLEKFWYFSKDKNNSQLKICKKTDLLTNVLCVREIIASKIYEKLNIIPYCKYEYVYNMNKDIIGCKCKAFTNKDVELVTAYDLLEEDNLTQTKDVYEKIIEQAKKYGANSEEITKYMDIQTIIDFLILNRDRHQCNIGFLRDTKTLQIIGPAPIYDSGSSRYMEMEQPEGITGTTVNGLYPIEDECLSHITHFDLIDFDKLPSSKEIRTEYEKSSLSTKRINQLVTLYEQKKEYLREYCLSRQSQLEQEDIDYE